VNNAKNIKDLRKLIGKKPVKIIAKIERKEAVENLEEIIEASDALMVARGDLAMEIGPEKVPIVQKKMIHLCNLAGKPVVTATQMLASMVESPTPTRAEVSDIANAIFDNSDGIMLSNETAVGAYPVKSIKVFAKVATNVEQELKKHGELLPARYENSKTEEMDALGLEVCELSESINAKNIIVVTDDEDDVRAVSKHRCYVHTIVITGNKKLRNHLALLWGINDVIEGKVTKKNYLNDIKKLLPKQKGKKAVILLAFGKEKHIVTSAI
jgi:pyruvate kinase